MVDFIEAHRKQYGVEPICAVLPIAPSTYYRDRLHQREPERRPTRAHSDARLKLQIQRVWDTHFQV